MNDADRELAQLLADLDRPAELDRALAELGDDLADLPGALDDDDPLLSEAAAAVGLL